MTYKEQFVVEVKCKGKILRVKNDCVYLPFGSDYSIYLKNLNSVRASVKIAIDGEDVLDGSMLVVNGNSSVELQGFLKDNYAKNKFKFIQKTKEIQDYRGDRIDDGIIRVEFAYEKTKQDPVILREEHHHYHYNNPFYWNYGGYYTGDSSDNNTKILTAYNISCCSDASLSNVPLPDEGITVKGEECNQQFNYTSIGKLEQSTVIIIRLKGLVDQTGQIIDEPIITKKKLVCSSCGKKSKSSFKFCPNCGTFLS